MSSPPVDGEILTVAEAMAREAAEITLGWFGRADLGTETKTDGSPVTSADRAAEDHLIERLTDLFPDDAILGEERGLRAGRSGRQWIIDPIDGTESFVRGVPLYSTLLALIDEDGPAIGIAVVPALGVGAVAGRGRGCHWDGRALVVNDNPIVAGACLSSSSFDQPWWPREPLERATASGMMTRTWGDGYGYVLVAGGQIEAMADPGLRPWDIAPMLTIIPEAGGRVSRWDGSNELADGPWLATNGTLHEPIRRILTGG